MPKSDLCGTITAKVEPGSSHSARCLADRSVKRQDPARAAAAFDLQRRPIVRKSAISVRLHRSSGFSLHAQVFLQSPPPACSIAGTTASSVSNPTRHTPAQERQQEPGAAFQACAAAWIVGRERRTPEARGCLRGLLHIPSSLAERRSLRRRSLPHERRCTSLAATSGRVVPWASNGNSRSLRRYPSSPHSPSASAVTSSSCVCVPGGH